MAEENQENYSVEPATISVRRKRGRPRKDDVSGSEPGKRTQRQKVDPNDSGYDPLVGQVVSGVLDGKFDAGYMLTVQVGNTGAVFRGLVFEPGLSVPISAANDVAPNIKMLKREEIPIPDAELRDPLPVFMHTQTVVKKDGVVKHCKRNEYTLPSKGSPSKPVSEYLTPKVQTYPTEETTRLPNNINHGQEDATQDAKSAISDLVPKDEIQDQPAGNAESSKTAHAQRSPIVSQMLQSSTSTPKQEQVADTSNTKPVITNGPSGGSDKAPQVAVQSPECETEKMISVVINGSLLARGSSGDAAAGQNSEKKLIGNETAVDSSLVQNSDKNVVGNETAVDASAIHIPDKNSMANEITVDASAVKKFYKHLVGCETTIDPSATKNSNENLIGNKTASDASAMENSNKNFVGNETAEEISSTDQKWEVLLDAVGFGSKTDDFTNELKTLPSELELEPQDLASQSTPVHLEGNMTSPFGDNRQAPTSDTIEATKASIAQSRDAVTGSFKN